MNFAESLTALIHAKRTSQSELARRTGIAQSTLSALANGKQRPYLDQALTLADVLGVSLDYLVRGLGGDDAGAPEGERAILRTVRALRLDPDEAIRRLASPVPDVPEVAVKLVRDVPPANPAAGANSGRAGRGGG